MKPILYIGQEVRVLIAFGTLQVFGIIIGVENKLLKVLHYNIIMDAFIAINVSSHFVVTDTII